MKYAVTIVQYGCMPVEANSYDEAIDIAAHQCGDAVYWNDGYEAINAEPDDTFDDDEYVTQKAYE